MARTRFIQPGFFDDEALSTLPFGARILFQALWCLADREGRLEDRPLKIAVFAFPYELKAQKDVPDWLCSLARVGCIVRYRAENGKDYLWVRNFTKHQRPHIREAASLIPPPQPRQCEGSDKAMPRFALGEPRLPDPNTDTDTDTDTDTERGPGKPLHNLGKPSSTKQSSAKPGPARARREDVDVAFRQRLQSKYPDIDVEYEHEKWLDWLDSTGQKYDSYTAAFRNWLRRTEERNGNSQSNRPPASRGAPAPTVTAEQLYNRGYGGGELVL